MENPFAYFGLVFTTRSLSLYISLFLVFDVSHLTIVKIVSNVSCIQNCVLFATFYLFSALSVCVCVCVHEKFLPKKMNIHLRALCTVPGEMAPQQMKLPLNEIRHLLGWIRNELCVCACAFSTTFSSGKPQPKDNPTRSRATQHKYVCVCLCIEQI